MGQPPGLFAIRTFFEKRIADVISPVNHEFAYDE